MNRFFQRAIRLSNKNKPFILRAQKINNIPTLTAFRLYSAGKKRDHFHWRLRRSPALEKEREISTWFKKGFQSIFKIIFPLTQLWRSGGATKTNSFRIGPEKLSVQQIEDRVLGLLKEFDKVKLEKVRVNPVVVRCEMWPWVVWQLIGICIYPGSIGINYSKKWTMDIRVTI